MKLLMPDYERQLKDATRRLAAQGDRSASRWRSLSSRLLVGISAAVALGIAALVLVLVHSSQPTQTAGQSLPAVQYDCGAQKIVPDEGPLVPIARGTVAGMTWLLEADSARHGLLSLQAGRLLLDGHSYGFCRSRLEVELINAGPHGVTYGLLAAPNRPPLQIEGFPGHARAAHPVHARNAQVKVTRVRGAFLYVGSLPRSACAYRNLAITATRGPSQGTLGASGLFVGTCLPGQLRQARRERAASATPRVNAPKNLSPSGRAEYNAGRAELGQTGCLACHQIGADGNHGPGPNLTHIGEILHSQALRATLINPTAPMPSYKNLPPRKLRAIVFFLQHLR
ncbi:MAG TPA: cytochrome c [Solirubrobacteraceae bacterium]|nr:cytochrome c [Solirubrobacteraceae bacterium]